MLKAQYYSSSSDKPTQVNLPAEFDGEVNGALLKQAIHVYRDRQHKGTAKVKTRAEVDITKKKIYRQKGTGGARHGASSAPIFVGGGVTHGPKGIKRVLELPRDMRRKALLSALITKAKEQRVVIAEGLSHVSKTKDAQKIISKVQKTNPKATRFVFVLKEHSPKVHKALRNIPNSKISLYSHLNALDVFLGGMILMDSALIETTKTAKKKITKKQETTKK